jgi:hypothetical protein
LNLRSPIFSIGALFVACCSVSSTLADEISQANLIHLGTKAAQYKSADSFSPRFDDTGALGRTFVLRLPLKPNEIPTMPDKNGGWTYSADTGQLTLRSKRMDGLQTITRKAAFHIRCWKGLRFSMP